MSLLDQLLICIAVNKGLKLCATLGEQFSFHEMRWDDPHSCRTEKGTGCKAEKVEEV